MAKCVLHTLSAIALLSASASATVLTFDIAGESPNQSIQQNYGDRVTAATMGNFSYGTAGGFTPNVVLSYGPSVPAGQSGGACSFNTSACVYWWDNDFADLRNVIAQADSGGASTGILEVLFTADPGWIVTLASLNLGGWQHGNPGYPASYGINSVKVYDQTNAVVYDSGAQNVPVNDPGHLSLAPNVSGASLRLVIDASNLPAVYANNVGLDNIQFSQDIFRDPGAVPEPAAFLLSGAGLVAVAALRRRKA